MAIQVALLRAVNVGGRGKVPMADLKACLTSFGLDDVRTLLQSGNVVFGSDDGGPALESRLEAHLLAELGLRTTVIIRTAPAWSAVVAGNPFVDASPLDPSHLLALLGKRPPVEGAVDALRSAIASVGGHEAVADHDGQVYVSYPDGIGRSKLTVPLIERALGTPVTGRNWNTVLKLAAMLTG
jgi:uncharacterized protein (DUF1697 family)